MGASYTLTKAFCNSCGRVTSRAPGTGRCMGCVTEMPKTVSPRDELLRRLQDSDPESFGDILGDYKVARRARQAGPPSLVRR